MSPTGVSNARLYASKCCPLKSSDLDRLKRNERTEDRVCTSALCERLRICNLEKALRIWCLTWYGHVQRSNSWISKISDIEVAGKKRKVRPSKTWGIV